MARLGSSTNSSLCVILPRPFRPDRCCLLSCKTCRRSEALLGPVSPLELDPRRELLTPKSYRCGRALLRCSPLSVSLLQCMPKSSAVQFLLSLAGHLPLEASITGFPCSRHILHESSSATSQAGRNHFGQVLRVLIMYRLAHSLGVAGQCRVGLVHLRDAHPRTNNHDASLLRP